MKSGHINNSNRDPTAWLPWQSIVKVNSRLTVEAGLPWKRQSPGHADRPSQSTAGVFLSIHASVERKDIQGHDKPLGTTGFRAAPLPSWMWNEHPSPSDKGGFGFHLHTGLAGDTGHVSQPISPPGGRNGALNLRRGRSYGSSEPPGGVTSRLTVNRPLSLLLSHSVSHSVTHSPSSIVAPKALS